MRSVLNAATRSSVSAQIKEEIPRFWESCFAADVPVFSHERDDRKLTRGGWTWERPESGETVDQMAEKLALWVWYG